MINPDTRTVTTANPEIGLTDAERIGVVDTLRTVLADEYVLYTRLRNAHWNVTGPSFHALHEMYEEQYEAIEEIIDDVAERVRTYGEYAPGTMREFIELARLGENPGHYPDAMTMTAELMAFHEAMVRNLRIDVNRVGSELEDVGAEDFLTGLLQQHQEYAWMLRAFIQESGS